MATITLAQAQAALDAWIAADIAVAGGQSYHIGTRSFNRTDAGEITEKIRFWNSEVARLSRGSGGIRIRQGVKT